ncbi:MAG: hypothetical protein MUC69_10890 [Gemmatimonadales bacterium]|nr:hypothetical protein [Gemmatimonadales bacterium]
MPRPRPGEGFEATLPREEHERDWLALAASALAHLVVILLVLVFARRLAEQQAENRSVEQPEETREVAMIYLPPPPQPTPLPPIPQPEPPAPQPAPVEPPAPRTQNPVPEPEPNAPPEAARTDGVSERAGTEGQRGTGDPARTDPTVARGDPDAARDEGAVETPEGVALEATMEAEARRIFGRKRGERIEDAGPMASRPIESAKVPDSKCPEVPRDSAGAPVQGVVQGVVRDQTTGQLLAGAHLQMVGQSFSTFANNRGEFRLVFDIALMADCRVQYVRIEAPGFRSQMLPIVIGGGVSTVALRRR